MAEYVMEYDGWAEGIPVGEYLKVRDAMHARKREEVVRCRDCEYARIMRPLDWRTGKPSTVIEEWYCQWHSNAEGASDIDPDGFCAWGSKRKEGE